MPEVEAFLAPNSRWCCRRMRLTEAEMCTYTFRLRHETVMFYIPSKVKLKYVALYSSVYDIERNTPGHKHYSELLPGWSIGTEEIVPGVVCDGGLSLLDCLSCRKRAESEGITCIHMTPPPPPLTIVSSEKRAAKYVVLKPLIAAACLRHPPDLPVNRDSTGSCWLNWQNEPLNVCPLFAPLPLISRLCQLAADFAAIFPAHCLAL